MSDDGAPMNLLRHEPTWERPIPLEACELPQAKGLWMDEQGNCYRLASGIPQPTPPTVVFVVQIVTPLFPAVDTGAQWDTIEPARTIRQRRLDEGFTPDQLRIVRRTITEETVE
jgi:hypothetical protein